MKPGSCKRALSVALLIIVPWTLAGAETKAMLYASGNVTIEGVAVPSSATVFAGENIQTSKGASAMILNGQSTIRLAADSSLVYGSNAVRLERGAALIVTRKAATGGRLAGLSVSPASADQTRFALVNQKGAEAIESIAALQGSLRISDGLHTVVLLPGQALTRSLAGVQEGSANSVAATSGQASASQAPVPATAGAGIPGWGIALILAGVVGGIVGGLAAAGQFETAPASPSKP